LAEVSIGHALISRALFVGLERVVAEYLAICEFRSPVG
jgi:pyridoxine 5'-phosphate synthase PdxJ